MATFAFLGGIRSANETLFGPAEYRALAQHLIGKGDLRSLISHCARIGVGIDRFELRDGRRRICGAILVATHADGLFFELGSGRRIASLHKGILEGATGELRTAVVDALKRMPKTRPPEWLGGARAAPTKSTSKAPAPKATKPTARSKPAPKVSLVAHGVCELGSRADVKALTPLSRAQLTAASQELCGKKGLPALLTWLDTPDNSVVQIRLDEGKTPRYDGWLTGACEDGVFFDSGKRALNGFAVSQLDVHDQKSDRVEKVAALQAAMNKPLRFPRRKR